MLAIVYTLTDDKRCVFCQNAGIEQWKYIQEEQALVSITTFRHMNLQTTMQFAHSRSSGFWFRENDSHVTSFTEYGEIFMERFPSPQSVDSILNYGQQITPEVLVCGSWRVSIQGPNISISHVEYPDLRITLDGDGFSCVPQSRSSVLLLGLPKANGIKVQQASPPIPIEC